MKPVAFAVAFMLAFPGHVAAQVSNIELIDAVAFLFFDLEDGKERYEIGAPAARQLLPEGAVQYTLIEQSAAYGSTAEENKEIKGSRYMRGVYRLSIPSPCVVSADVTEAYSDGTSRVEFGIRPAQQTVLVDLTKYSALEAKRGMDRWVEVNISGTGVVCFTDETGQKCHNDFMGLARAPDAGSIERVLSRKLRAIDFLKARGCTGRPY